MKNFSKILLTTAFAIVFLLGANSAASAANTIKIGYTAPFTGAAAEFGANGWRGIQLALDDINKNGIMVNGKKYEIEIIRYDSVCTPTEGVANIRKMVMQDQVVAILGDHCSSVCNAIAPLSEQFKVPGITVECAADNVTKPGNDFYFRMRPSVGLMAPYASAKIMQLLHPKTVGFLVVNDDYGLGLATANMKEFDKGGVKTVLNETFERGTTDFSVYLAKVKQAQPDVLLYVGVTSEGAMILKQARELGITKDIAFVGSEEMGEMELLSLAGPQDAEGTYAISQWGAVPAELEKRVQDEFGAPMHYAILFGYDALRVVAEAIKRAQSLDPKAIRDAMKQTDMQGLAGRIKFEDFDGYKNQGKAAPTLIQWKDGKRVPLEK